MLDGDPVPLRPSARPDIFTDERMKDHVRLRHIDRGSDGTLFPEEWSEREVFTAIDAVLTQPGSVQARGQFLNFYGTHNGVRIMVRLLRRSLRLETGHPVEGPGVTRRGRALPIGTTVYRGIQWTRGAEPDR